MAGFFKFFVSIILVSFIVGCSGAPKQPVTEGKTLVVGKVVYEGEGIDDFRSISINGNDNQKVDLTMEPGGSYGNSLRTGPGGLFYALVDANEKFTITKIRIKRKSPRGDSLTLSGNADIKFTSAKNGVTNIGTILWLAEQKDGKIYGSKVRVRDYKKDLEGYFKEQYPDSPWVDQPWYNR